MKIHILVLISIIAITGCAGKQVTSADRERDYELINTIPGIDQSQSSPHGSRSVDREAVYVDWSKDSFWNQKSLRGAAEEVIISNVELINTDSASISVLDTNVEVNKIGDASCVVQMNSLFRILSHSKGGVIELDWLMPINNSIRINSSKRDCSYSNEQLLNLLADGIRLVAIQNCSPVDRLRFRNSKPSPCLY